MFRDVIERFAGRYEVWHEQQREERGSRNGNPLTIYVLVVAVLITIDWYRAITDDDIEWRLIVGTVIGVAFLVAFGRKSELAWLIFPIWGTIFLIETPWVYLSETERYPIRTRILSGIVCAALGLAGIAYGFLIQKRYRAYLDRVRRSASVQ